MLAVCGFILVCFFLSRPQVLPNAHKEEAPFSSFSHRNRRLRIAFARLEEAGEANSRISRKKKNRFFGSFWNQLLLRNSVGGVFLSHGHARTSLLLHLLFFFFYFFLFSFLRGDDVRSVRIQSGGSSISHNAIPPKVYDSRNWRISRPSSSSSSSCAPTSPRSAVRSRRIVERRRGVTKKKKKKKMEASLTTGEAGENFLLVMWAPLHFVVCLFVCLCALFDALPFTIYAISRTFDHLWMIFCSSTGFENSGNNALG